MATNWERLAKAAIAYKNILKQENTSLRRRVQNLEGMVEAMFRFIEEYWPPEDSK